MLTSPPAMLYLKPYLKSVDDASVVLPGDLALMSETVREDMEKDQGWLLDKISKIQTRQLPQEVRSDEHLKQ